MVGTYKVTYSPIIVSKVNYQKTGAIAPVFLMVLLVEENKD
jgi:hypothetical protein